MLPASVVSQASESSCWTECVPGRRVGGATLKVGAVPSLETSPFGFFENLRLIEFIAACL